MANLLQSLTDLLKNSINVDGDPPPPIILQSIGPRIEELGDVSLDSSGGGIDRWLAKLRAITKNSRLQETLLVRAIQIHFPRLAETLTLLGIIGFEWDGEQPTKPVAFSINWQRLDDWLTDPGNASLAQLLGKVENIEDVKALQVLSLMLLSAPRALLGLEYRQQGYLGLPLDGVPGFTSDELLQLIEELIHSPLSLSLPFELPLNLVQFRQQAKPIIDTNLDSLTIDSPADENFDKLAGWAAELRLMQPIDVQSKTIELGEGWLLRFKSNEANKKVYRIQFSTAGLDTTVRPEGEFSVLLTKEPSDPHSLLLGEPNGTHFAIRSVHFGLHLRTVGPLFNLVMELNGVEFAIKPDFLKFLNFGFNLPSLLQFNSDIHTIFVQGKGLAGQGSDNGIPALGFQFTTPLNLKIGGNGAGIEINQVSTRLEVMATSVGLRFRLLFRYGASAKLGPLTAILDGAGVWFGRWSNGNGGLLAPQGIGLSLDAGPVSGSGLLKFISENEFAGALQLKILGIGAFAYSIYKVLPSGAPSFVALIGVRLPLPGIQIGFGFAVSGFGGLVGINRRANLDLLRERLMGGIAGNVLFSENPTVQTPKLLGDMEQLFPDEHGIFLIGPTLQINWLSKLTLDVGIFIELPGPRKVFIAGTARLIIGSTDLSLVYLRMDFIGGVDLTKSLIFFDAALIGSHVLSVFRISGGVALRIAFGSNGYFLFTVGGFHPAFNPGSLELPRVARVGVSFALGPTWMKLEMYLAITSSTFQLGARVEAGLDIEVIKAHGWFIFDALIQLEPFYFVVRIDAGFEVEALGISLCNVRIEGQLSGPGPLMLQARASIRRLFIKVSGNVTIKLSNNPPEKLQMISNLPEYLKGELTKPDNLRVNGVDRSVIFAPQVSVGQLHLFIPVGELIWEQKRVPLNIAIEKIEGVKLNGWHTLQITSGITDENEEEDWFGVGTYLTLTDSEALNQGGFTKQKSGLRIGTSEMRHGYRVNIENEIALVKLPKRSRVTDHAGNLILFSISQYVNSGLADVLSERQNGAKMNVVPAQVFVQQEVWHSHNNNGIKQNGIRMNAIQAFIKAKQTHGVALPANEQAIHLTDVF